MPWCIAVGQGLPRGVEMSHGGEAAQCSIPALLSSIQLSGNFLAFFFFIPTR